MTGSRRPLLVVAGVFVRGSRLLLARRPMSGSLPGLWELPGGKVDPDESPANALVREWREELGVRVAAAEPALFTTDVSGDTDLTLLFFRVTALCGEPRPLIGQELRVSDAREAALLPMPAADVAAIEKLAREGGGTFADTERKDAAALCERALEEEPHIEGSERLATGEVLRFVKRGLLGRERLEGFLVLTPAGPRAFENLCPHAPQPLDRPGESVLTADGRLIVCRRHEAFFVAETGHCVGGPSEGQSLTPIPLVASGAGWAIGEP